MKYDKIKHWLKIRWKDTLTLLKALGLLIVGLIVFNFLLIVGVIYSFIKHVFVKRNYSLSRQFTPIIRAITLANDGVANAGAGELLNDTLKPIIKYGKWYHTISADTGLNFKKGKDNRFRELLDCVLGKKHCVSSINEEQKVYYKL